MAETVCQCCGQRLPGPVTAAELRAWCQERGHRIHPHDRVDERAAADVLGVTAGHLRNRRCYFNAVPHHRIGSRVLYDLAELVRLIEA